MEARKVKSNTQAIQNRMVTTKILVFYLSCALVRIYEIKIMIREFHAHTLPKRTLSSEKN